MKGTAQTPGGDGNGDADSDGDDGGAGDGGGGNAPAPLHACGSDGLSMSTWPSVVAVVALVSTMRPKTNVQGSCPSPNHTPLSVLLFRRSRGL